ncbi:MAG: PPC domain-containing protein [Gemmataceae bacterium]|nr:PPC domain-containing protein [Gemmataceae bacterium]
MNRFSRLLACFSLAAAFIGMIPEASWSQKKKTTPPAPPPGVPVVAAIAMGGKPGAAIELNLTGSNLGQLTGAWSSIGGQISIVEEGKTETAVKVRWTLPPNAPIGYQTIRVGNHAGSSNVRIVCVDDLPQVLEAEGKNNDKTTPQAVAAPCVIAGKTDAEKSDWYKVSATAGQKLSFEIVGRRLGSPIDPQIAIYSAKPFREVAFDNDSPGAQTDARLTYVFKQAGEYLIEVRDVLGRGGADYPYRLRIADVPLANVPIPMAAKRGTKAKVAFAGPNVEGVALVDVDVPADPLKTVLWLTPKGANGSGWPVPLFLTDVDEAVEQEPNQEAEKANRIAVPGGVTGRLSATSDVDVFVFAAKKGQKIAIEGQTMEWNSPSILYMTVKNPKTKADLAKSNPAVNPPADQKIDFTAPEDGDYLLEVQHLNFVGGPAEAYHISLRPTSATFEIDVALDKVDMSPGSVGVAPFAINRKGYNGAVELTLVPHPHLSGSAKIKPGQKAGVLLLQAKADTPMGPTAIRILAKANIDGKDVTELASARSAYQKAFADLMFPPFDLLADIGVGIKEPAPFVLTATVEPKDLIPGGKAEIKVKIEKKGDFAEEITLNPPQGLPTNVPAPKVGAIGKDAKETSIALDLTKATTGEFYVLLNAKSKTASSDTIAVPLILTAPFDLALEPATLEVAPGGKAKLKVTAARKANYKGPISLELRNLPEGVTAAKAMIPQDQTAVEIEIAAAATAAGMKTDVDILGAATAMNNLAGSSNTITVRAMKK